MSTQSKQQYNRELTSDEAVAQLGADPQRGLSAQQAVERLRECGANELDEWRLGAIYPIPCLLVAGILRRAMLMRRPGATISWRGTRYRLYQS